MTSSLRDALRQSGVLDQFKPPERKDKRADGRSSAAGKPRGRGPGAKPERGSARKAGTAPRAPQSRGDAEMDLAKAYALRAQSETRERERKLQAEREAAERRRAQREAVASLLAGKTLNRQEAETARHFEYGGKIRRVYVTDEQLEQVNDGRIGVIQLRGGYLLVERALAESISAVDAGAVALLVDPASVAADER